MNKTQLKERIHQAILTAPHHRAIKRVALFGSRAYGKPRKNSDIDILIEFQPRAVITLLDMAGLENYFSKNLKQKVDLRTPEELSRYFRKEVLQKAESIYEV